MIFGYQVYLEGKQNLIRDLNQRILAGRLSTIISLNTLKIYQGDRNKELEKLFKSGTHIIPDGQSIALAEFLVHGNKISSISGAELMVDLIKVSHEEGHRLFFLGSPEGLLQKVREKIQKDYPNLTNKIAFQNGYYDIGEEDEVVQRIAEFAPDFLFVAFGSPRKEEFIIKYKERLNAKVIMGVGGSYEYFVGDVKLDRLTKKLGLRWLIRTLQDPKRLAKRYAICNTHFALALTKEIITERVVKKGRKITSRQL